MDHGSPKADHLAPAEVMAPGHRKFLEADLDSGAILATMQMREGSTAASAGAQSSQPC